jgi:hypothetical protein
MTEKSPLERAARILCEQDGNDADELVETIDGKRIPRWYFYLWDFLITQDGNHPSKSLEVEEVT